MSRVESFRQFVYSLLAHEKLRIPSYGKKSKPKERDREAAEVHNLPPARAYPGRLKLHRADVDCTNRIDEYLDAALEALIRKHGIPDKPFRSPKKGIVAWISEGTERKIRRVCVYLNLDEDQAVEAAVENLLKRNGYHTDIDLASVGEETR